MASGRNKINRLKRCREQVMMALSEINADLFSLEKVTLLKVGILEDLIKQLKDSHPEISKGDLRVVLRWFTNRVKYLNETKAGNLRYGLDGKVYGEVTLAQEESAKERLLAKKKFKKNGKYVKKDEKQSVAKDVKKIEDVERSN